MEIEININKYRKQNFNYKKVIMNSMQKFKKIPEIKKITPSSVKFIWENMNSSHIMQVHTPAFPLHNNIEALNFLFQG